MESTGAKSQAPARLDARSVEAMNGRLNLIHTGPPHQWRWSGTERSGGTATLMRLESGHMAGPFAMGNIWIDVKRLVRRRVVGVTDPAGGAVTEMVRESVTVHTQEDLYVETERIAGMLAWYPARGAEVAT